MIISDAGSVTEAVTTAYASAQDSRTAEIVQALVRHLHALVDEVDLTESELEYAIGFLNRVGQASGPTHNEATLLSDALGVSTLVCLRNNGFAAAGETTSALLGPFWRSRAPRLPNGASLLRCETEGTPTKVRGIIRTASGEPLANVRVDVWQASPVGLYENQDPTQASMNLRGVFSTDADGQFWFQTVRPAGYPVPTDGPTGDLLRTFERQAFRPAHLHFLCYKPGYRTLITQIFPSGDPFLQCDPVFGVTEQLIGDYDRDDASLALSFVMAEGDARMPTPPID